MPLLPVVHADQAYLRELAIASSPAAIFARRRAARTSRRQPLARDPNLKQGGPLQGLYGLHERSAVKTASHLQAINRVRNTVLCRRVMVADTTLTRLFGLLGQKPLASEEGLLIKPSSGVHTWGMTFAIDIVALDQNDCVSGIWHEVGPWHIRGLHPKTRSVLELAPGAIHLSRTAVGDALHFVKTDS